MKPAIKRQPTRATERKLRNSVRHPEKPTTSGLGTLVECTDEDAAHVTPGDWFLMMDVDGYEVVEASGFDIRLHGNAPTSQRADDERKNVYVFTGRVVFSSSVPSPMTVFAVGTLLKIVEVPVSSEDDISRRVTVDNLDAPTAGASGSAAE